MNFATLFLVAVGLSMDAFAVAVTKGLSLKSMQLKKAVVVGLYFGGFQAAMPLLGYLLAFSFSSSIEKYDHFIALILLSVIGGKMIYESFSKNENEKENSDLLELSFRSMIILAIATSIDALAVGISFAFLQVSILPAIALIGVTTFLLSVAGVYAGRFFGAKLKSKAELFGGSILIIMGIKIFVEHVFY